MKKWYRTHLFTSLLVAAGSSHFAYSQVWTPQTSGTGQILESVSFVDANHGWAVGNIGTIVHTTNGGANWSAQVSGTSNVLRYVTFTDVNNGWAVGNSGTLLHTSNGGTNWAQQTIGTPDILWGVSFVNANNGWVVGFGGNIFHTTNGGTSWVPQTSGTAHELYAVKFIDANNGWAVGVLGTILSTTNGGANWNTQFCPNSNSLVSVDFVDANNGWTTGSSVTILHTTDGGANWIPQNSGLLSFTITSIHFLNNTTGWATVNQGTILHTVNSGANWTTEASGTSNWLAGVQSLDNDHGWIVGDNGTILAHITDWTQVHMDNTGPGNINNWTPIFPPDPYTGAEPPLGIFFANLIIGSNPTVASSRQDSRANAVSMWGLDNSQLDAALPSNTTIDRFWDINTIGGFIMNATLTLRFTASQIPLGITDPNTQIIYAYTKHGEGPWGQLPCVVTGPDGNGVYSATITGVSTFSDWSLGGAPIVLPVEMTSFSATGGDGMVTLRWHTETESNNSHFTLYRSATRDGISETITQITGHGTTPTPHDYSFTDTRVQNGTTYYYHIGDVSSDGSERMQSTVVQATPAAHATGFVPDKYVLEQNYPNPFNPVTQLSFSLPLAGPARLSVSNVLGQQVAILTDGFHQANVYHYSFDASRLPAGVYYYTLTTNDYSVTKRMTLLK